MFTYEIITDLSRTRPIFLDSAENNKYNVTITILRGEIKMVNVTVCVGSTCHVKGTNLVVERFKALIAEKGLSDKVSLRGMFCVGNCQKGVSVTVDGVVYSVHPETADEFFAEQILSKVD